jgi:hypothetical protein
MIFPAVESGGIEAAAAEPQHSSRRISHVGMPLSKRSPLLSDGQNDDSHCCCLGALQARGQFYSKLKVRDHVTSLAAFSTELADQAQPTRARSPSIFRYIHSAACGRAVDILRCHRPRLRAPYHWPIDQPPPVLVCPLRAWPADSTNPWGAAIPSPASCAGRNLETRQVPLIKAACGRKSALDWALVSAAISPRL